MWKVEKMCLNCRFYRLKDVLSGTCRVDSSKKDQYPIKLNEDICDNWVDCGQQYYIRTGWIKGRKKQKQENMEN